MIRLKIDVTKIDKDKLFRGQKGIYLDATLIETPNNKHGDDYMIVQDVGKQAREAGERGAILGNGKVVGQAPNPTIKPAPQSSNSYFAVQNIPILDDGDGIPF